MCKTVVGAVALTMRPAGLSSGIDQDRADYTVFCGERNIGVSMKSEAVPSIYGGFGRCTFPASRKAFAQITA
jgi:hypothetical protein